MLSSAAKVIGPAPHKRVLLRHPAVPANLPLRQTDRQTALDQQNQIRRLRRTQIFILDILNIWPLFSCWMLCLSAISAAVSARAPPAGAEDPVEIWHQSAAAVCPSWRLAQVLRCCLRCSSKSASAPVLAIAANSGCISPRYHGSYIRRMRFKSPAARSAFHLTSMNLLQPQPVIPERILNRLKSVRFHQQSGGSVPN